MSTPSRNRVLLTAVAATATLLLLVVLFVNATTASRVADNAERLHWANATLGTAALARLSAGQVATFEQLTDAEVVPGEALTVALSELDDVTGALADLVAAAPGETSATLDEMLNLLERRPVDNDGISTTYGTLAAELRSELAAIQDEIEASDSAAARTSVVLRLMVTLIIPATAILAYRRKAASQVREAGVRMESQVEAERQINRAKDQFIAGMSHEIRTPLTAIYGFSEVMLDAQPDAGADRDLVAIINAEAAELSRMMDDFIAVSRIDGPGLDVESVDVDIASLAHLISVRFARRGVPIVVSGSAPAAVADAGRTQQVLVNLISNAVVHGQQPIRIALGSDNTSVRCAVIDDGPGVAPNMTDRLFTRFIHQGTDVLLTGSLGLGTWVAREFAQAMGGTVTYTRLDGKTAFTLSLPAAATSPAAPTAHRGVRLVRAESAP